MNKNSLNKFIFSKLFSIFDFKNTNDITNNNPGHITNLNYSLIEIFLNKIEEILNISTIKENEDFFLCLINTIPKFQDLVNFYTINNNWRILKKISFIFKSNFIYKLNNIDLHIQKIFSIAKKLLTNECFEIKKDAVKIIANISLSKNYKEEILKFVESEIFSNKNFYIRRLYLYFFKELLCKVSYKFLSEKGFIDNFMKFINDNNLILTKFFRILKKIIPLITEVKTKFLIYNKLEILRKDINTKLLIDTELIFVRNFYLFSRQLKILKK